jgi:hypothetical protein
MKEYDIFGTNENKCSQHYTSQIYVIKIIEVIC